MAPGAEQAGKGRRPESVSRRAEARGRGRARPLSSGTAAGSPPPSKGQAEKQAPPPAQARRDRGALRSHKPAGRRWRGGGARGLKARKPTGGPVIRDSSTGQRQLRRSPPAWPPAGLSSGQGSGPRGGQGGRRQRGPPGEGANCAPPLLPLPVAPLGGRAAAARGRGALAASPPSLPLLCDVEGAGLTCGVRRPRPAPRTSLGGQPWAVQCKRRGEGRGRWAWAWPSSSYSTPARPGSRQVSRPGQARPGEPIPPRRPPLRPGAAAGGGEGAGGRARQAAGGLAGWLAGPPLPERDPGLCWPNCPAGSLTGLGRPAKTGRAGCGWREGLWRFLLRPLPPPPLPRTRPPPRQAGRATTL